MKEITLKYEERYVAFLDILGFEKMVHDNNTEAINSYLKSVSEGVKSANDVYFNDKKRTIESIIISDSIILSIEKNKDYSESLLELLQLCISVAMIQTILAEKNIWLRGGISCGDTHFDQSNHQIIGPAYIAAYNIEQNISKYPRVALDSKIIKELNFTNAEELITALNTRSANHNHILYSWENKYTIKQDIPLFIDYLGFLFAYDELPNQTKTLHLHQMIDNINNSIYTNMSAYTKHKWSAEYLNSVLARINPKLFSSELKNF